MNIFQFARQQKRPGGVTAQADDAVGAKLANDFERAQDARRHPVERVQHAAQAAPFKPFDRQRFQFESLFGQHAELDSLFGPDKENFHALIAPLKFPRHRQPGEQMTTGSPAGENHSHRYSLRRERPSSMPASIRLSTIAEPP